jgi:hypothetical protein
LWWGFARFHFPRLAAQRNLVRLAALGRFATQRNLIRLAAQRSPFVSPLNEIAPLNEAL